MPMFNTVAIRIHPVAGATRAEVVRDVVDMARRFKQPLVFDWNGVKDFVVWPDSVGRDVAKALDERMKALSQDFEVKGLADPLPSDVEAEITKAADALAKLHDLAPSAVPWCPCCDGPPDAIPDGECICVEGCPNT